MNCKKDVLIILNPREHEPSIQSLKSLDIPKVWISAYNEKEALAKVMEVIEIIDYENYILISDDVLVKQEQIDVIVENNKDYDILTGYCNLHPKTDIVNLAPAVFGNKLTLKKDKPVKEDYPFNDKELNITYDRIQNDIKDDIFETYSIGFSFTSFKKHVLKKYPLLAYGKPGRKGMASDHHISYRIVNDGIYKMYAHKKCYFTHLKLKHSSWKSKDKRGVTYEL
jgi:hypothetical protein